MNCKVFCFISILTISFKSLIADKFPDGTIISDWFFKDHEVNFTKDIRYYNIVDYGVINDSNIVQTSKIQAVIDLAHKNGGGVIVISSGTFLSGSLFFKAGTHLYLEKNAVLKGSDDISDFALLTTRIEGQTIKYFAALVNVDSCDGFTLSGEGTINGNGFRYWKSFWLRRQYNPHCTNLEELRPRLLYVSNSKNVMIKDIKLVNSPFWTTHFYKCENIKLINLYIYAPHEGLKAPSSDAIDLDVCKNVHIKNCTISVNDDAIALKGGKGPLADKDLNNGPNSNVIIENCTFLFCHSALTCGSESIHNWNIILRNSKVNGKRLLTLKMRPDTPQKFEKILVENIEGNVNFMIDINPWLQFFDLKGEKDTKVSYASDIKVKNVNIRCQKILNVKLSDQYRLSNFYIENLIVKECNEKEISIELLKVFKLKNIKINDKTLIN